ncbi:MAG TPA: histidine--tRNA ligase [Burkholderiales bacterium]
MQRVKPALLKGFDQEFLPAEQLQFNALLDLIRSSFELYGFLPIETPSAELKEVLTSKGAVEKEIYGLSRLAAAPGEEGSGRGALRFDLTVPLARYVAMREHQLVFPFRRYQIQRVWRGENPQANKGRFREFYQCDIDVIGKGKLSALAEAEIPSVIYRLFTKMDIGAFRIRINNRKVLKGLLQSYDVAEENSGAVLRELDKIEKVGKGAVIEALIEQGVKEVSAERLYHLLSTKLPTDETLRELELVANSDVFQQGVKELRFIVGAIRDFGVPDSAFTVDLGVVRGLDYYTGTIYETTLIDHPDLGSICSGGRYDDLASYFTATKLPGVGISIGLSRLFAKLKEMNLLKPPARTPAEVLVTAMDPQLLGRYLGWANRLRGEGINTEVYLETAKLGEQLSYAEKKGFRVALVAGSREIEQGVVQVKQLATKSTANCPEGELVHTVKNMLRN